MKSLVLSVLFAALISPVLPVAAQTAAAVASQNNSALQPVIAGEWRSADNKARDRYRHPLETLTFFGIQPNQTVIEITPGGGWYSEILSPFLKEKGQYIAGVVDYNALPEGGGRDYQQKAFNNLHELFKKNDAIYNNAKIVAFSPLNPVLGEENSVDAVLTFRNVHNWRMSKQAEGMFKGFFNVLKPGGTLGVVEHRANNNVADDDKSGYVSEEQVIQLATAAGFKLVEKSEINANPRDTKDHPKGVWMLPPNNRHPAEDAAKYQAIGESDRMTLKFVKP